MVARKDGRHVPVQLQPENIPAFLKKEKRWVVWLPKWEDGKFGKKPGRIDRPGVGLTNWAETGWVDFDTATAAWAAHPHIYGGVGYVMTGSPGVTGVDLDHCIDEAGVVAPWAEEIIAKLDTYTEVSPSGSGLRAFVSGELEDWQTPRDGAVKIEVYGGAAGRFLTVTGAKVPGAPPDVRPPKTGVLADMRTQYRMAPKVTADIEDLHLPDVIPDCLLPEIESLGLPSHARNFLSDGPTGSDRSRQLFATAISLVDAGLSREEVFSVLANNEHALSLAEDHWKGHAEKALRYLWKHSAQEGEKRANDFKQIRLSEFDELGPAEQAAPPAPQAPDLIDEFTNLDAGDQQQVADPRHGDLAPIKKARFAPETPAQFLQHRPPNWIIKGVVPRAGLAVIYGASSSGKTFFTLDMVGAIARGADWRGVQAKKGRVLYVVAEGAGGFRNRLQAYCDFHGVDPASLDIGFLRESPNLLAKDDIREFLKEVIAYGKVDLIVIDTYARAMAGGNENDAKDVGQAVAHCDVIHRKTGALVVLVHHSGKDASKGARGSGALRAAADLEIEVEATRDSRTAKVTKQKDGADNSVYAFRLVDVQLGEDEDGDAITSCVVGHCDTPSGIKNAAEAVKGHAATVLSTITAMLDLDSELTYADAIDACVSQIAHDPNKRDRRRDVVIVAFQALQDKGVLRTDSGKVVLQ